MSTKRILLTCVLCLGSVGISQAHPLDSPDIVYIDGMPCNSACQSYMAWSRRTLSMSGRPAPTQLPQRSANEVAHHETTAGKRLKPAAQARVSRQAVPLPRAKVAILQPADNAAVQPDVPPDKAGADASSDTTRTIQEHVATAPAEQATAAAMAPAPEQNADSADRSVRSETIQPGATEKTASAPPYDVARLEPAGNVAAGSNTRTIQEQVTAATVIAEHVVTLRDAEKAASASPGNTDLMVVLVIARPEINSISDLTGKDIAIDDRLSASSDKVRTAIAAAGAAEVHLSEGQTRAINRLIGGEVPAAVLTLVYQETGFPQFAGFNIFRIPLAPRSLKART